MIKQTIANNDCVVPIINPNCLRIPVVKTSNGFVPRLDAIKNVAPNENRIHPTKYKTYLRFFLSILKSLLTYF